MIKKTLTFLLVMATLLAGAQDAQTPQMADALRQDGKIYVVIAVIGLIFLSLVLFLVYIERRVKKLEERLMEKASGASGTGV